MPQPRNFARSAIAPLISAGVMIANISWKAANAEQRDRVLTAVVGQLVDRRAEPGERELADEAAAGVAESQRVAVDDPQDAHDRDRHERHHHHVERALGTGHAAVEERETGGHQQHQGGAGEDPSGVSAVELHQASRDGVRARPGRR